MPTDYEKLAEIIKDPDIAKITDKDLKEFLSYIDKGDYVKDVIINLVDLGIISEISELDLMPVFFRVLTIKKHYWKELNFVSDWAQGRHMRKFVDILIQSLFTIAVLTMLVAAITDVNMPNYERYFIYILSPIIILAVWLPSRR